MRGAQSTMRKVGSKLQASSHLFWLFGHNLSSFRLHGQADNVLSTSNHQFFNLVGLLLRGRHDKEQLLKDSPVGGERFGEFSSRKESRGLGKLSRFDIFVLKRDGWKNFAQFGCVGVSADVEGKGRKRWVGGDRDVSGLVSVQEEWLERGKVDSGHLPVEQLDVSEQLGWRTIH